MVKPKVPRRVVRRVFRAFREFARLEAAGGLMLMGAALIALVWANSPWASLYDELWHTPVSVGFGELSLSHDLHWWINEALMVVFFFVVGLEIKRELLVGELSSVRKAALPVLAAVGGMLVPALLYLALNRDGPGARGWGVPMATDIAFALGVMALLGSRIPIGLKIFLTALAIVDDLGAVLVIALFYTGELHMGFLLLAAGILGLLLIANAYRVQKPLVFSLLGIGLWVAFLGSGLHATLAGVLLAFTIPAVGSLREREFLGRARGYLHEFEQAGESDRRLLTAQQQEALVALEDAAEEVITPLQQLEHSLHPWVIFGIVPLFALANAGVKLGSDFLAGLGNPISLGVMAGLLLGKPIGINLAVWLALQTRLADLPEGVSWRQIYGSSLLAGIGFTMSLFIASLAFGDSPELDFAKGGIITASLAAGIAGYFVLRSQPPTAETDEG